MPGPQSDQFKGQRGDTPLVPTWMEEGTKEHSFWLSEHNCPICSLLLDEGYCHECGGYTGKKEETA